VILVDANLLIYAAAPTVKEHAAARSWLDGVLNGGSRVGLPWPSLLTFLRLVANPRVFNPPARLTDAWGQVERWLSLDSVWIPSPTERHPEVLGRLLAQTGERGDLAPDAHLAALAIEHGLTLCSSDRDFARFSGLRWENPIDRRESDV
jgi:toxin-antitoxin system PIN domain toxin